MSLPKMTGTTILAVRRDDKVVIGGDLQSLVYAVSYNYPVLFAHTTPPFQFDTIEEDLDFSRFGIRQALDMSQTELWEKMLLFCGLSGLLPLSSNAKSI